MRIRMKRVLSLMLLTALLFGCVGCRGEAARSPETIEDLYESNELVLCYKDGDYNMENAVKLYRQRYPDVEVKVDVLEYGTYQNQLSTELMAGKGPDVVRAAWGTFPNLYKIMKNGTFLDLTDLMSSDPDFRREDYVEVVLDAGKVGDRQYLIPTTYMLPVLVTEESALRDLGLEKLLEVTDMAEFWPTLLDAASEALEQPQLRALISNIIENHFLAFSGVKLYDQETDEMLPDPDGLRSLTDRYLKIVYQGNIDPDYCPDSVELTEALRARETALGCEINANASSYFMFSGAAAKAAGTLKAFPMVGEDGELYAVPLDFTAINSGARNTKNAWEFIKILLSIEVQSRNYGVSIRKDALEPSIAPFMNALDRLENIYKVPIVWTREEIDTYLEMLQTPAHCLLYENDLWEIYKESMTPYFEGSSTYETCLEALRQRLQIYMTE